MSHLVVVAAGTGGHVMPGLAVAEALRGRGWSVSWLGTRSGMERGLVERHGIAFDAIDFSGLRGKGLKTLLLGGFLLLRAMWQSRARLRARSPKVVFSTGGYVAVPAGMAASTLGVPLVLMNSDADSLLSTRLLAPIAAGVLCGFDGAAAARAGSKGLVTGNPVRAEIAAIATPAERYAGRSGPLRLLVIGGSLGAQVLNETVPSALAQIPRDQRPRVVHQCGEKHVEAVRDAYRVAGVDAEIIPFIEDIARRYAEADVVLCRAGAITVTELAAAGVPGILVPLIVSTTQHQRTNAEFLAGHGAAVHLPQSELTKERLATLLAGLTRPQLLVMANAARALGRPHATATVAAVIERVAA
ncbi:MAG TPA: undecaprenyldiphospho-muramoylpentapeptide beta-N-acetylglucosaminyltransferase [Burkholderiaceae bacterium]|nr:undecaprenyldiphospho-muramoylpentapeptide beta-N-acetylglucosaminyltransferase [Burkholderiaceae bacterium]HQR71844.1 undecaprenyldiphospho-muramoylpentapeptide beta-N-acetylglucosaminyltransferase [Burkholderiaceae bacterium]